MKISFISLKSPIMVALALTALLPSCSKDSAGAQINVVILAGGAPLSGGVDGTSYSASFTQPNAVAVDANGNVFVADFGNNKIRKITPSGVVTTLAGNGTAGAKDGLGTAATFFQPSGIAVDGSGNVYVAENNQKIRKISPGGMVTTFAGTGSIGSLDGTGISASFTYPSGLVFDKNGTLYVLELNRVRKITPSGVVTTFAGNGTVGATDGMGGVATFNYPNGITIDGDGNIYIADTGNNKVRKITSSGLVSTLAGLGTPGAVDGAVGIASLRQPTGIAADVAGNVFVGENRKVRKISVSGIVSTIASTEAGTTGNYIDGNGVVATFNSIRGLCIDANENIYVADYGNNEILKIVGD